jgi:hypothetical protein
MEVGMTESTAEGQRWRSRVEETFNKLRCADRDAQELACKSIQEEFGSEEAGAKLRELFAADKAKFAAEVENVAFFKKPVVQPNVEAPKIEPGPEPRLRRLGEKPQAKMEAKASAPEAKPAVVKPSLFIDKGPVIGWPKEWPDAPLPPPGADKLLYPPGLLGHATQYVFDTAPLPDRKLSLATALSALGKGIDRKVIGPSGNSTILFNQIIAETGSGKHHGISCSRSLLRAMGMERSIVASGLALVQAIEQIIEGDGLKSDPNPNALVVIDEVGSWLQRILSKGQGGNVSEIPGILQTLWGQPLEDAWIGTKKVGKEMKTFYAVAFSIIGFSTEKMFFRALEDRLISSGFVNRMLLFDVGRGALERVDPKYPWTQCPEWLLKALCRVTKLNEAPIDRPIKMSLTAKDGHVFEIGNDLHRLAWGPGAKERWLKFDNMIRAMPSEGDRELWIRAPDLTVRLATIVAFYRCSGTVDVGDWDWAIEIVKRSTQELKRGVDENLIDKLEQADLAKRVRDHVRKCKDAWGVPIGEVRKLLERKVDDVRKIDAVIWHVVGTGDLLTIDPEEVKLLRPEARGRPTIHLKWNRRS